MLLFFLVAEVVKVLRAKKYAKAKKQQLESVEKSDSAPENTQSSSCDPQRESEKKTSQVYVSVSVQ